LHLDLGEAVLELIPEPYQLIVNTHGPKKKEDEDSYDNQASYHVFFFLLIESVSVLDPPKKEESLRLFKGICL
tara:strand:- start:151 stop:369 length:219 start_codon:yes stop_codon:yes gene_type:complete